MIPVFFYSPGVWLTRKFLSMEPTRIGTYFNEDLPFFKRTQKVVKVVWLNHVVLSFEAMIFFHRFALETVGLLTVVVGFSIKVFIVGNSNWSKWL